MGTHFSSFTSHRRGQRRGLIHWLRYTGQTAYTKEQAQRKLQNEAKRDWTIDWTFPKLRVEWQNSQNCDGIFCRTQECVLMLLKSDSFRRLQEIRISNIRYLSRIHDVKSVLCLQSWCPIFFKQMISFFQWGIRRFAPVTTDIYVGSKALTFVRHFTLKVPANNCWHFHRGMIANALKSHGWLWSWVTSQPIVISWFTSLYH